MIEYPSLSSWQYLQLNKLPSQYSQINISQRDLQISLNFSDSSFNNKISSTDENIFFPMRDNQTLKKIKQKRDNHNLSNSDLQPSLKILCELNQETRNSIGIQTNIKENKSYFKSIGRTQMSLEKRQRIKTKNQGVTQKKIPQFQRQKKRAITTQFKQNKIIFPEKKFKQEKYFGKQNQQNQLKYLQDEKIFKNMLSFQKDKKFTYLNENYLTNDILTTHKIILQHNTGRDQLYKRKFIRNNRISKHFHDN